MVENILSQKSSINQLKQQKKDLKHSFRKLGHYLRSPVNGIMGIADLILSDPDPTSDSLKDDLRMITEGAQSVLDLTKNIMLGNQVYDHSVEPFTIRVLLDHRRLYRPQAKSKRLELTLNSDQPEEEVLF